MTVNCSFFAFVVVATEQVPFASVVHIADVAAPPGSTHRRSGNQSRAALSRTVAVTVACPGATHRNGGSIEIGDVHRPDTVVPRAGRPPGRHRSHRSRPRRRLAGLVTQTVARGEKASHSRVPVGEYPTVTPG